MLIKSFKINHKKLKPGIYLHEIKRIDNAYITTFDLRFKRPNQGKYLSNVAMHSLEHLIATFYTKNYKEKIYFGPMGCQTGFYLVVGGKKDLKWLEQTLVKLNKFITKSSSVPGANALSCGNYKTLSISVAKKAWTEWYGKRQFWGKKY